MKYMKDAMTALASGLKSMKTETPVEDGGAGSGNWGHAGRPGKRGGSGKGGGSHYREGSKESGYKAKMLTPGEAATKFGSRKGVTAGAGRGAAAAFAPKPKVQPKPATPKRQPRIVNGKEKPDNPVQQKAGDFVFEQTGIDLNKYRQHPAVATVEHALGWDKDNSNGIVFDWKDMSHNEQSTLQRLAQKYGGKFELQDAGSWAKTLVWKGDKPSEQQPTKPARQPKTPRNTNLQQNKQFLSDLKSKSAPAQQRAEVFMDKMKNGTTISIPSASGAPIELEKRVVRENGNYTARWIQKQSGIYFGTLTGKRAIDVIRKNGSNITINEPDTENNTEFR